MRRFYFWPWAPVDAGTPTEARLVALIDRDEPAHGRCVDVLPHLSGPLVTTWPALTEAIYLIGAAGGWRAEAALWRLWARGDLQVISPEPEETARAAELMEEYADVPMDLADATLVAAAEVRRLARIFTLGAHLRAYRPKRIGSFHILP